MTERLACLECGGSFTRPNQRGRLPDRCPTCNPPRMPAGDRVPYPPGLVDRRYLAGVKVDWLARKLGVSRSTLTYWEQGSNQAPVVSVRLAEELIAAAELELLARLLELHPEVTR